MHSLSDSSRQDRLVAITGDFDEILVENCVGIDGNDDDLIASLPRRRISSFWGSSLLCISSEEDPHFRVKTVIAQGEARGHRSRVVFRDFHDGSEVGYIEGHHGGIMKVRKVFSGDGLLSHYATASDDSTIGLWSLPQDSQPTGPATLNLDGSFVGHTSYVVGLSVLDSSSWHCGNTPLLFSCSWDKTCKLWDLNKREEPLRTYSCFDGEVMRTGILTGTSNRVCACSFDGTIKFFDPRESQPVATLRHETGLVSLCVDSKNKVLYAGDTAGSVGLWCSETLQRRHCVRGHDKKNVWDITICGDIVVSCSDDESLTAWNRGEYLLRSQRRIRLGVPTKALCFVPTEPPRLLAPKEEGETTALATMMELKLVPVITLKDSDGVQLDVPKTLLLRLDIRDLLEPSTTEWRVRSSLSDIEAIPLLQTALNSENLAVSDALLSRYSRLLEELKIKPTALSEQIRSLPLRRIVKLACENSVRFSDECPLGSDSASIGAVPQSLDLRVMQEELQAHLEAIRTDPSLFLQLESKSLLKYVFLDFLSDLETQSIPVSLPQLFDISFGALSSNVVLVSSVDEGEVASCLEVLLLRCNFLRKVVAFRGAEVEFLKKTGKIVVDGLSERSLQVLVGWIYGDSCDTLGHSETVGLGDLLRSLLHCEMYFEAEPILVLALTDIESWVKTSCMKARLGDASNVLMSALLANGELVSELTERSQEKLKEVFSSFLSFGDVFQHIVRFAVAARMEAERSSMECAEIQTTVSVDAPSCLKRDHSNGNGPSGEKQRKED